MFFVQRLPELIIRAGHSKAGVAQLLQMNEPLITSLFRSGLAEGRGREAISKGTCLPGYPPKHYEGGQAGKHVVVSGCSKQYGFIIKTYKT
jgi:hypothetical protein